MYRSKGYTLIEVVAAVAIFAMGAMAIYELLGGAGRRAGLVAEKQLALLTAQSTLDDLRARPQPWPAEEQGKTDAGMSWRTTVSPVVVPIRPDSPWHAVKVDVEVTSTRYKNMQLALEAIEVVSDQGDVWP